MSDTKPKHTQLKRQVGVWGAVFMGLGAMVGTGVFVSIGIAAGLAGPSVLLAIVIAAGVATCNGLSSAQLAAAHPVSGGTYEYGYKYLTPQLGFTAGWMFLVAKSASAATATLGVSVYFGNLVGSPASAGTLMAVIVLILMTALVIMGIKRSNQANIAIVSITLFSLLAFIVVGGLSLMKRNADIGEPSALWGNFGVMGYRNEGFLQAIALMFVAYTGYGRIATLGEEVKEPAITIPRAVIATMLVTATLYLCVAYVAIGLEGPGGLALGEHGNLAPLFAAAGSLDSAWLASVMAVGAVTAMLGVLLNLILGLSRVLLAMGRRQDAPAVFAQVHASLSTPVPSVIGVCVIILIFALLGDIKLAWSFSAFTVLIYYSITNLAALKQPPEERRYPKIIQIVGLSSCLFLAFQVDARTWQIGIGLILAGLGWHTVARGRRLAKNGKAD